MPVRPQSKKTAAPQGGKKPVASGSTDSKLAAIRKKASTAGRLREGYKRLNVDIPDELHRKLKLFCIYEDAKQTDVVFGLLDSLLSEWQPPAE